MLLFMSTYVPCEKSVCVRLLTVVRMQRAFVTQVDRAIQACGQIVVRTCLVFCIVLHKKSLTNGSVGGFN